MLLVNVVRFILLMWLDDSKNYTSVGAKFTSTGIDRALVACDLTEKILPVSGSSHEPPMCDQGLYSRVETSHSFRSTDSLIFTII